jgi:hypothetical protein
MSAVFIFGEQTTAVRHTQPSQTETVSKYYLRELLKPRRKDDYQRGHQ